VNSCVRRVAEVFSQLDTSRRGASMEALRSLY
jgi:hypothetical protein